MADISFESLVIRTFRTSFHESACALVAWCKRTSLKNDKIHLIPSLPMLRVRIFVRLLSVCVEC